MIHQTGLSNFEKRTATGAAAWLAAKGGTQTRFQGRSLSAKNYETDMLLQPERMAVAIWQLISTQSEIVSSCLNQKMGRSFCHD